MDYAKFMTTRDIVANSAEGSILSYAKLGRYAGVLISGLVYFCLASRAKVSLKFVYWRGVAAAVPLTISCGYVSRGYELNSLRALYLSDASMRSPLRDLLETHNLLQS